MILFSRVEKDEVLERQDARRIQGMDHDNFAGAWELTNEERKSMLNNFQEVLHEK